ncbi:MAG: HAMP domain-containing histidine kinase [Bacillaceae bacterium]|uniref:histidine kinase n=1 Tax=Halalkalibacter akibai (strain ATCC 43226 / DSM 21942 / CIP 109018 / JCM 9157 / 1139) TaxID=1236973 RepID=W4QUH8_HALA3|nr:HAMP domain-containing sensor histidine kinase [Halalkalibacter akibai]MDX5476164.1 HAMP domain-containing histidine kinase [Bacillaceae bacterium]GAE35552.1 two-component sensor histidine kinase [Halalkalibacter akibai JCM 9157]
MKLSTKVSLLVLLSVVLIIVMMGFSFYTLSKSFYKNQLQGEIEHRLDAHREVVELHTVPETLEHVMIMEKRNPENTFIIFDANFNVKNSTQQVSKEMIDRYQSWIVSLSERSNEKTEFVNTMTEHIPHIWSYEPFKINGELAGYLFIDQDTGSFEEARLTLLGITISMGLITLLFSGMFTIFLSKKITLPITNARDLTKQIAKGNFDVQLSSKGNDEIDDLLRHISTMAIQLKEYRDTRQQFLTNVSHDIRTPLTYIKGYAALLKDQKVEADLVHDQATIIHQEAVRMESLVKNLFQLMKLEEGKIQLNIQEIDLVDFIQEVKKKVTLATDDKKIDILFSYAHPTLLANIDPDQFERVLLNLLNNSIRHTNLNGKIQVRLEERYKEIIIEIEDNGEGIPAKDLPYIWDRFYRVDKSRSTKYGGSGLGLAITKQIIEQHGGTIQIKSTVNVGTVFTIRLNNS